MFSFLFGKKTPLKQSPIPFGWKTGWFCINAEPEFILPKLAQKYRPISWDAAIKKLLIRNRPFLTQSFDGWTILSKTAPNDILIDLEKLVKLLNVDVAYFESHRGVGAVGYGWTKNKSVVRTHRQADGQLFEDFGKVSEEEVSLGIFPILDFEEDTSLTPLEEDEIWEANPDEEDVTNLSGLISINPSQIDTFPESIPFELTIRSSIF